MQTCYRRLEQLIADPHTETAAATIWAPKEPVNLEELADLVDIGVVIARLQPSNNTELVEAFVTEFIGSNAAPYHVELFGALPNEIIIRRPDLVSRDAVAAGLRHYVSKEDTTSARHAARPCRPSPSTSTARAARSGTRRPPGSRPPRR